MEAAKLYFIIFGVLTIVGGIGECADSLAFTRGAVRSQISAHRKGDARGHHVDPERDRDRCGNRRLGKKVIAWQEFAFGHGGGWCWLFSPRFSPQLFTA